VNPHSLHYSLKSKGTNYKSGSIKVSFGSPWTDGKHCLIFCARVCLCVCPPQWKCCGVIAYTDWHEALQEKVVPDRCCQEHYQNCGHNSTNMFWNRVSSQAVIYSYSFFVWFMLCGNCGSVTELVCWGPRSQRDPEPDALFEVTVHMPHWKVNEETLSDQKETHNYKESHVLCLCWWVKLYLYIYKCGFIYIWIWIYIYIQSWYTQNSLSNKLLISI